VQLYPSCSRDIGIGNCCGQAGSDSCGCFAGSCRYRRVVQAPLVWESTFFKRRCVCA
jgi:hypothetical protein